MATSSGAVSPLTSAHLTVNFGPRVSVEEQGLFSLKTRYVVDRTGHTRLPNQDYWEMEPDQNPVMLMQTNPAQTQTLIFPPSIVTEEGRAPATSNLEISAPNSTPFHRAGQAEENIHWGDLTKYEIQIVKNGKEFSEEFPEEVITNNTDYATLAAFKKAADAFRATFDITIKPLASQNLKL